MGIARLLFALRHRLWRSVTEEDTGGERGDSVTHTYAQTLCPCPGQGGTMVKNRLGNNSNVPGSMAPLCSVPCA
jgi:hypothetical protein